MENFIESLFKENFFIIKKMLSSPFQISNKKLKQFLYADFELLRKLENVFHGKSSGLDIMSVLFGGLNMYSTPKNPSKVSIPPIITPFKMKKEYLIMILKTNVPKNTGKSVNLFLKKVLEQRIESQKILDEMGRLTMELAESLGVSNQIWKITHGIQRNHKCLQYFGVSSNILDKAFQIFEKYFSSFNMNCCLI